MEEELKPPKKGGRKPKAEKPPTTEPPKVDPPDHLTMNLFAPGMTALHRAGLGGLACTLKAMERQHEAGLLRADKLPGAMIDAEFPWTVTDDEVTLRFGTPEKAREYLKKLFAFAFQIRDGVIYLPGQYPDPPPTLAVRAAIQEGIQNTFLQHGPTCGSREGERLVTILLDADELSFTHDVFTSYKHQGWFWLDRDEKTKEKDPTTGKKVKTGNRVKNHQSFAGVAAGGTLSGELHEIDNKISPGGMVRHDRFKQSAIREPDSGLICLHFALIGCLTLCANRVTGILIVPEVQSLEGFVATRRWLTPLSARECRVASGADAGFQGHLRIRARQATIGADLPQCTAITCRPTKWNEKQKGRVDALSVLPEQDQALDRFERALAWLPPRVAVANPDKKGKRPEKVERAFWVDSIVRPLIAENLALGRKWYEGFIKLMTKTNPASGKPYRDQLSYREEREGLHAMISDPKMWDQDGERRVVEAVHEAMRMRYGRIAKENEGNLAAMEGRMKRFREKLRLDLAGAKTEAHVRFALTDLFSRGGNNAVLREHWETVLPVIRKDWQLARDLGLLALASYAGKDNDAQPDTPNTTDAE